jgi:hypothetical protein
MRCIEEEGDLSMGREREIEREIEREREREREEKKGMFMY